MSKHLTEEEASKIRSLIEERWTTMHSEDIIRLKNVLDAWEYIKAANNANATVFELTSLFTSTIGTTSQDLHDSIPDAYYDIRIEAYNNVVGTVVSFLSGGTVRARASLGGVANEFVVGEMKGVRLDGAVLSILASEVSAITQTRVILTKVADAPD